MPPSTDCLQLLFTSPVSVNAYLLAAQTCSGEQWGWDTGEFMGERGVREAGEKRVRGKRNRGKLFNNA